MNFNGSFTGEEDPYSLDNILKSLSPKNMSADPSVANKPPGVTPAAPSTPPPTDKGPGVGTYVSQALAGLGDAITGAYGTNKTNFTQAAVAAPDEALKREQVRQAIEEKKKSTSEADALKLRMKDPLSAESRAAQSQAQKLGLFTGRDLGNLSYEQLNPLLDNQIKVAGIEEKKRESDENRGARKDQNELMMSYRDEVREQNRTHQNDMEDERKKRHDEEMAYKKQVNDEKDIQKFGDKVAGFSQAVTTLGDIENKMGFSLDKVDPEALNKGMVKVQAPDGKKVKVDLPGVSVPLLGRVSAYSSEAKGLQQDMDKLFNTELKDRSGAAVTTNELERLRKEWGQGKYQTEEDMVRAAVNYKRALHDALKAQEARFRGDVVSGYKGRGGLTSDYLGPVMTADGGQAQTVRQNGKVYQWDPTQKKYIEASKVGGL
jgi:hypothetical protein